MQTRERTTRPSQLTDFVDCDVHIVPPTKQALFPYLEDRWQRHIERQGGNPVDGYTFYPRGVPGASRVDSWPPQGGPPGSHLGFMQEQYLDRWQPAHVILGPLLPPDLSFARNIDLACAVATAMNEWVAAEWLAQDDRLRGSIIVPFSSPEQAAAEIRRWGTDPRFVQVYGLIRTGVPAGNRFYWPIYRAAEEVGLPVGLHYSGTSAGPISGAGWVSYYLEEHTGAAQIFQNQLVSLVMEGVFEQFPGLRVALIEGGVAWLPALAWRLDRAAELFADEVPFLRRRPSEYISDHVWMTSQPIEEPARPGSLTRMLELFPALERRMMFSSDYPHWDFDQPDEVLRKLRLKGEPLNRYLRGNARELYGVG